MIGIMSAKRISRKGRDLAEKIANDVSEGIDAGESREVLRLAVRYWSDAASREAVRCASAEDKLKVARYAKRILDTVL